MIRFKEDFRTVRYGDGALIPRGTVTDVFSAEQEEQLVEMGKAEKTTGKAGVPTLDLPPVHAEDIEGMRRRKREIAQHEKTVHLALEAIVEDEAEAKERAERAQRPRASRPLRSRIEALEAELAAVKAQTRK